MLVLLALGGCGGSGHFSERESSAGGTPAEASSPLRLRLEAPSSVRAGERVPLRLVLENGGAQPVQVELGGRPIAFDFVVVGADGAEVWSRLHGQTVPLILQVLTLAPGESLDFRESWSQRTNRGGRVAPGSYRVRGTLPVVDRPGGWNTEYRTLTIQP